LTFLNQAVDRPPDWRHRCQWPDLLRGRSKVLSAQLPATSDWYPWSSGGATSQTGQMPVPLLRSMC